MLEKASKLFERVFLARVPMMIFPLKTSTTPAISPEEARPGDLVFYSGGGGINHVAIYIGNGQIVHASSPDTGIIVSDAGYRSILAIRRIF